MAAEEQIRITISSGSDRTQSSRQSVGETIWSAISAQLTQDTKEGLGPNVPEKNATPDIEEKGEAEEQAPPAQCGEQAQRPRNGFTVRYAILTQDDVPDPRYPFGSNPNHSVRNAAYRTNGGGFGIQTAVDRSSLYRSSAAAECGDGTSGGARDRRMPTPPMGDPGLSAVRYTIRRSR